MEKMSSDLQNSTKTTTDVDNPIKLESNINASQQQQHQNTNHVNPYIRPGSITPRPGSITPSDSMNSVYDAHYYNDRIRALESEKLTIMIEHNNLIKEFNKRIVSCSN